MRVLWKKVVAMKASPVRATMLGETWQRIAAIDAAYV
jgi:hypothetical protein